MGIEMIKQKIKEIIYMIIYNQLLIEKFYANLKVIYKLKNLTNKTLLAYFIT